MEEKEPQQPEFLLPRARSNGHITSAVGMDETAGALRARRHSLFNRTVIWATGVICFAFLVGTLWQAWNNSQQLQQLQTDLSALHQLDEQHTQFVQDEQASRDPAVIEKEAREKLGYIRPGEQVVIIVPPHTQETAEPIAASQTEPASGYWSSWWQLFFGK